MSDRKHSFGLVFICVLVFHTSQAESYLDVQSEFESYKQQSDTQYKKIVNEFERHQIRLKQAFDRYQAESEMIWGKKNTVMPKADNWVSYLEDMRHRGVVDFKRGTVTVELAVDKNANSARDNTAREALKDSLVKLIKQGADNRSMLEIARNPVARPEGKPVLQGQIADQQGQPAQPGEYQELAEQAIQQVEIDTIVGGDGQRRTIYRAQLHLVDDHIRRRAQRYQRDVHTYAEQQAMPAPLIYAIMETESMFNPMARSPAPAFGLMQLVPNSGAREAYRYLFKKDRVVNDAYLYNTSNNIQLGSAFLNRLYYHYFSGIKDPQTRIWATVAAYNTGAGNVFRTFAGRYTRARFGNRKTWKRAALNEINRRSPEQVYTFMRQHLPYVETRSYLKKVRSRIGKYRITKGA